MKCNKVFVLMCLSSLIILKFVLGIIKLDLVNPKQNYNNLKKNSEGIPYIDIENGSKLHLRCKGNQPMQWHYPKTFYEDKEKKDEFEINESCWKNNCVTNLVINEALFYQTGFYSCVYEQFIENSFKFNNTIYIFVNDDENLIVPYEGNANFIFLLIIQFKTSTIPCLPTNSKTNITLWKVHTSTQEPELVKLNQKNITYDNTIGFTFKFFRWTGDLTFLHCQAEYKNITQLITVNIKVSENQPGGIRPIIETTEQYVLLNSNFSLDCIVQLEIGVFINIKWLWPNQQNLNESQQIEEPSESVRRTIDKHEYEFVNRKLNILNASLHDEGNYTCIVTEADGRTFIDTKYISILNESLPTSLILNTDINQNEPLTIKSGEKLLIVIEIYALPSLNTVKLDWYKNNVWIASSSQSSSTSSNNSLINKVECQFINNQAILIIQNTTVQDSGVYTLEANNLNVRENLTIIVEVLGLPYIENFDSKPFYEYNKSYTLICSVISFPKPNLFFIKHDCLVNNCSENKVWQDVNKNINNKKKLHHLDNNLDKNQELDLKLKPYQFIIATKYELKLKIVAKVSNIYRCIAENEYGFSYSDLPVLVSDFGEKGFDLFTSNSELVEQDDVKLTCIGSKFNFTDLQWFWKNQTFQNLIKLKNGFNLNSLNYSLTQNETNFSLISNIHILNSTLNYSGTYICTGYYNKISLDYHKATNKIEINESKELNLKFHRMQPPKIIKTNMYSNLKKIEVYQTTMINFYCEVTGKPKPKITWKRNGHVLNLIDQNGIETNLDKQHLTIKRLVVADSGRYECTVSNRAGTVQRFIALKVKSKDETDLPIAGLIGVLTFVIIGFIFVIMAVFMGRKIREDRKQKREFEFISQSLFQKGRMELFNPDLPFEDQIELLPYKNELEFPLEKLRLGPTLGQGAFGRVVKGEAEDLNGNKQITVVAVKMLKETADLEQRKALMAELKILIHLGRHLNIVNLLGAITLNLSKGELFLIVEYCEHGNLRQYLMSNRMNFIDQVDHETGEINTDINKKQVNLYVNDSVINIFRNLDYINTSSICSNRIDCNSKQAQKNLIFIKTIDLICYAFQVSRGMSYLASRKLIHRDLAARNVLLAENNIVKICDFGLAKDCYKYDNYIKKGNGLLPIKWMAVESIADKIFTIKSDVWSFGVLLWELFTLGSNPYPGLEVDEEFYRKLRNGYRMEEPYYCPDNVYLIMKACWEENPNNRPSFEDLSKNFGQLLGTNLSQYYIDLNLPYQKMNQTMYQENEGYLLINSMQDEEYLVLGNTNNSNKNDNNNNNDDDNNNINNNNNNDDTRNKNSTNFSQFVFETTNECNQKKIERLIHKC